MKIVLIFSIMILIVQINTNNNKIEQKFKSNLKNTENEAVPLDGSLSSKKIKQIEKKISKLKNDTDNINRKFINTKLLIFILTFIFFLILIFVLKIRQALKKNLNKEIYHYVKQFSNELFLFIYVIAILKIICYFEFLKFLEDEIKLNQIEFLLTMFILFYVFLNFILLIWCYLNFRRWNELETFVLAKELVFKDFESSYIKLKDESKIENLSKEKAKYSMNLNILKYLFLRNEFIKNSYTPIIKECLLRDDFNFSEYLGKCLLKTLFLILKFTTKSLFSFIFFFIVYFIIRKYIMEHIEIYIMIGISIIFFIIQNLMLNKTKNIFMKIHKSVTSPYDFKISNFDSQRGNYSHIDKINLPSYLEDNYADFKINKNKISNPHESLFWNNNPNFLIDLLHIMTVLQIIYSIIFFTNYFLNIEKLWIKVICIITTLFTFSNLFSLLPLIIKNLSIITNIQMLKDYKIIHEVIDNQKNKNSEIFKKFYRFLKVEVREICYKEESLNDSEKPGALLNELIINQIRDLFNNLSIDKIYYINLEELIRIVLQITNKLNNEELLNFIQRANLKLKYSNRNVNELDNKDFALDFQKLMEVIEEYKEESEWDVYQVCYKAFKNLNNDSDMFSISKLENFLLRNKYFTENEINIILNEYKYIQSIENVITVEKASYLVDSYLSNFPK